MQQRGGRRDGIQPITIPDKYLSLFQNNFKTDKDYLYANLNNVSKMNYLLLPLMLKFEYPIAFKGHLRAYIEAGPNFGYLLASKQVINANPLRVFLEADGTKEIPSPGVKKFFGSSIDTIIDGRDELHHLNVGVQGGLGLVWVSGKSKIFIEGGGNYGFIPVQKGNEHGKNNIGAATILLGYMRNIHW